MATFIGLDPSMNNWGYIKGSLTSEKLIITQSGVLRPKDVQAYKYKNETDIAKLRTVLDQLIPLCEGSQCLIAEVPFGSQSADAMKSYGIVVATLSALNRMLNLPLAVVSENSRRIILDLGKVRKIPKKLVINWAVQNYPELDWPRTKNGKIIRKDAEHIADAIAASEYWRRTHIV